MSRMAVLTMCDAHLKFPVLRSEAMHNSTLLQRNALKVGAWVNEMERRVELVRCGAWAQAQDL